MDTGMLRFEASGKVSDSSGTPTFRLTVGPLCRSIEVQSAVGALTDTGKIPLGGIVLQQARGICREGLSRRITWNCFHVRHDVVSGNICTGRTGHAREGHQFVFQHVEGRVDLLRKLRHGLNVLHALRHLKTRQGVFNGSAIERTIRLRLLEAKDVVRGVVDVGRILPAAIIHFGGRRPTDRGTRGSPSRRCSVERRGLPSSIVLPIVHGTVLAGVLGLEVSQAFGISRRQFTRADASFRHRALLIRRQNRGIPRFTGRHCVIHVQQPPDELFLCVRLPIGHFLGGCTVRDRAGSGGIGDRVPVGSGCPRHESLRGGRAVCLALGLAVLLVCDH